MDVLSSTEVLEFQMALVGFGRVRSNTSEVRDRITLSYSGQVDVYLYFRMGQG